MADTDPVTSPETDPAYAQVDQDAEPTMTAPSGLRPDAATHPDPSDEYADKLPAEEVIMHFTVQNLADMVARRAAAKEAA